MDIQTLTKFFMWCTIINGGMFILWITMFTIAPDLVYRTQKRWFGGPRETFDMVMYGFLGLAKIFFLVFVVVPFISLLIIG